MNIMLPRYQWQNGSNYYDAHFEYNFLKNHELRYKINQENNFKGGTIELRVVDNNKLKNFTINAK